MAGSSGVGDLEMMFNWMQSIQSLIGTVKNNAKNEEERAEAMKQLEEIQKRWNLIEPQVMEKLQAELQGDTQLANIQEDPRFKQYQMQALGELGKIVEAGGAMTAEDRLAYDNARMNAASTDMALRGAAEANASARGLGAAGRYVGALQGGQAGANRASQESLKAAADSRQRFLQALSEMGQQASTVRGQEYNMAANEAAAQDSINRFNTGQKWAANTAQANAKMGALQGQTGAYQQMYQAIMNNNQLSEKDRMAYLAALNNFIGQSGANFQRATDQMVNGFTGNWGQMMNTASGNSGGGGGGGGMGGMLSGLMGGGGGGGGFGGG